MYGYHFCETGVPASTANLLCQSADGAGVGKPLRQWTSPIMRLHSGRTAGNPEVMAKLLVNALLGQFGVGP